MAEAALHTETTCKIRHVHIECPICLSRFTDPKILDCLHSFCLKCLQELIDKQDPKTDLIICPMCKKQTSIPDEGLSDLLSCFFLSSLIDDVINLEGSKEDINSPVSTCEGCDEGLEAVSRCVDCDANFCKTCLDNHAKLKVIRHHQIVDAVSASTERPKDKDKTEAQKCRKHTDQDLRFYCDTCELLACPVCAVFDHRASNHNLCEINDSIRSYRRAVDETLQKFDECRKQFQKVDNSIKYSQQRLQLMVDQALRDIVAKEEEEITKIRNSSRLLQETVTQIGQERGEEFESIQSSNHDKMSRAEQIVASVNDLMQHADNFELLDLKPKVMHNLDFHKELQFQTVQHSKSFIRFKGHDIINDADLGEILEEEKWEVKTEFGKCGGGEGEFKFARDVACFSNGDIVVTDTARRLLSTFTSKGSYKSAGGQSGTEDGKLIQPYGVAVTSDDLLLVTDGQDVKVYDRELRYIRQFRPSQNQVEGQSKSLLRGISVDNKDRIAVADCKRKVISLHNMDGSIISTIHHDDISSDCYLSISSKERLIFTNYQKMKLVCVDFMGNEVFNISTSIDGKPAYPNGVCCDDAGDIYVSVWCDGLGINEIHHYDTSGERIGCVARGMNHPLGMTFTPTGDLIVADVHSVKVLGRL
ncbi:E3 ubiquitin-protein ligase TRIM71-like [Asterias rubens]|uniref:E3 ubiquitin-protein ligase TRIM71-like n=1 Tax=Asterias rubens TaxID=7604 RepID=UPI0014555D09|nr:E3 ubiquitin-protein ligase TRIM71-like [Asterias rubens]XP_033631898.1 E3 ubiquitin-protein ligase TRIM71-like [Asterias rubens]XP_033631899.1 E3 ubiquitin-protein ligase TRIM71-like [Asterias rubens]XP_033631900.1 E3 ubiquitin-protein ligase TRIM71-like [Asterias rubens]XP_033631901.1 E3 ubiquitin-protein ligase TRIM71-like [Asterias rubens]XP_033631902.1 E3 ubiquitin-protein ligase TRIM71-like [Asterias rubens]XP_033631903.1 E3 ubiquitin-protein ligase TRIM71-like [Asterias rubens]XP_0